MSRDFERRLNCSEAFALREGREGLVEGGAALRVASRDLLHNDIALATGKEMPSEPVEFVGVEGRTPSDLIGTTYATLMLISDQFTEVLKEHGFTGWTTFPVKVSLNDGSELEGYHGLAISGRCAAIDDRLSEEVILPPPAPGGRARPGLRGLCFPPESWDGSDFFTAEGHAGVFVVERVKRVLEDAGVSNVAFSRLSEIERTWRSDKSTIKADH